jgi:hypothetical protein
MPRRRATMMIDTQIADLVRDVMAGKAEWLDVCALIVGDLDTDCACCGQRCHNEICDECFHTEYGMAND